MTLETTQNSQEPAQSQPMSGDQGSSGASPTSQTPAPAAPAKPEWLTDDSLFDAEKGVKLDELGARYKELAEKSAEAERIAAERKANTPEKAEDYALAFPEGFKAPEDFQVDENSVAWKGLRDYALSKGMTKQEFGEAAAAMVSARAEEARAQMAAVKDFQTNLFKTQLGDNWSERVESVNRAAKAMFGEQDAAQLAQAQFTPAITKAFEKLFEVARSQGVTSFNGSGREEPSQFGEDFAAKPFKQQWASAR